MYGLAMGIAHVGNKLPDPVYALLSGLNSATVGIIALAAVQLSQKAITDRLTRIIVFSSAAAGMLYSALWYFPVIVITTGITTLVWDTGFLQAFFLRMKEWFKRLKSAKEADDVEMQAAKGALPLPAKEAARPRKQCEPAGVKIDLLNWKVAMAVLGVFVASFVTVILLRSLLRAPPRGLSVFSNLYLAGTLIFGGGPVVIPLLREYIVSYGWVSPRDFLLGLAVIQAFPGPNFNFAVYLGALALAPTPLRAHTGALAGFVAVNVPGLLLTVVLMGGWSTLRAHRWLQSVLRGVNAAAVGLVYTAVYRLWHVGLVAPELPSGISLGEEPWWVVVTGASFVGCAWFGINAPCAILMGGALGLIWYAVVKL